MKILGDAQGPYGQWQQLDFSLDANRECTISCFKLQVPHAHPFWSTYLWTSVHLRPVGGRPDAQLHFPGATHEFMLLALDPNNDDGPPWHYLLPPNVVFQMSGSDDECKKLTELFADAVINNGLPVEDGGRALSNMWKQTCYASLDHLRGHPIAKAANN